MRFIHRSILARALMTNAALLPFTLMGAAGVRAETVIGAEGAGGANRPDFTNLNERGMHWGQCRRWRVGVRLP